ncbi:MAG: hypothetical protein HC838_14620 [Spirulinaceae cyanobacterium RM2_2_10]|nr:hypothetical protein [Spirulinaceae cyanobacterium SM2_1_0]NJO21017.1 hypothetical protein [Spirulinaceae cyanobacterium RM2_2_10]
MICQDSTAIELDCAARWALYRRLQELAIPCQCGCDRPLKVAVDTPTAAIQLWSAIRRIEAPRPVHLDWLERCWQLAAPDTD